MKNHLKSAGRVALKLIVPAMFMVFVLVLPSVLFAQNPGDNPDARPQDVALDPRMSLLLIAVGSFLAVKVMRKGLKPQGQVMPAAL
jgi:hypothetical protein